MFYVLYDCVYSSVEGACLFIFPQLFVRRVDFLSHLSFFCRLFFLSLPPLLLRSPIYFSLFFLPSPLSQTPSYFLRPTFLQQAFIFPPLHLLFTPFLPLTPSVVFTSICLFTASFLFLHSFFFTLFFLRLYPSPSIDTFLCMYIIHCRADKRTRREVHRRRCAENRSRMNKDVGLLFVLLIGIPISGGWDKHLSGLQGRAPSHRLASRGLSCVIFGRGGGGWEEGRRGGEE